MDELGGFLRSRRARMSPENAGVRTYGERRRVRVADFAVHHLVAFQLAHAARGLNVWSTSERCGS